MAILGTVPRPPPLSGQDDVFTHLFKTPAYREPQQDKSVDVELYIAKCHREISKLKSKPARNSNLTRDEQQALVSLKSRQDIVIKPADKGGAVVVWDRELYLREAHRQLNDAASYKPLPQASLPLDQKQIADTIKEQIKHNNLPATAKLLLKSDAKQPTFYLLPKIHKPNTPGRPIVSACSCPTEFISEYLDFLLQPIVQSLPTYVKDTTHTLNLLEHLNSHPSFQPQLLFTLDVVSLYTSIPHTDGLKALTFFLDRRPTDSAYPPTTTLVRLAELVLTLNTFEFDGQIFEQISGVAMGTKMGPSYACLFMGHLEHLILQSYSGPVPELYKRFIDDGLGATSLSEPLLLDFIHFIQAFHPSIKFTFNISSSAVVFLDISISILHGRFTTSVFYKETDAHSYLDFNSSHHPANKSSIPFSQFLRLRRLCSEDDDFHQQSVLMTSFFLARNYPDALVRDALLRVTQVCRESALSPSPSRDSDRPVVSLLFHPHNMPVSRILKSNWHILQGSDSVGSIFTQKPLCAFRKDRSVRDLLVRSRLRSPTNPTAPGTFPCSKRNCKSCPFLHPDTCLQGPRGSFTVKRTFDCQSHNVVYAIVCLSCRQIYIGETARTLEVRFSEHLADIRHSRNRPVSLHFTAAGHSLDHVRVMALWQVRGDSFERKLRESHIISSLGTTCPDGINIRR
ncbi:uncharacterized protein [Littorina saxatilis]